METSSHDSGAHRQEERIVTTARTPNLAGWVVQPIVLVQKMIYSDDSEAFINAFERMLLVPCMFGLAQQAVDTLLADELANCHKVKATILQILKQSPEAYRNRLREIEFGPDYHPHLVGQKSWAVCLGRLRPETPTKE